MFYLAGHYLLRNSPSSSCLVPPRVAAVLTSSHSSGKGGAGNIVTGGPPGVDMSQLTLEEREAYAKVHAHDREHGVSTGRG